jgi:hypothetical protein
MYVVPMRPLAAAIFAAHLVGVALLVARVCGAEPPASSALPAPSLRLVVGLTATPGTWRMSVVNADATPVRILADARKLSLQVRAPGDKSHKTCILPNDMRGSSTARQLVLEPGQSYAEFFDPRLYCWGDKANKLVKGASITAFLGLASDEKRMRRGKPEVAPFFAEPVKPPATFSPVKRISSPTTWLDREVNVPSGKEPAHQPSTPGAPELRLRTPAWADAIRPSDARLTAVVRNVGQRRALVHLRPDDLEIAVTQPNGTKLTCGPAQSRRAAVRDFFQTIGAGKKSSVRMLLQEFCPMGTFDHPGLYELQAVLHVRESGEALGVDAYTGVLRSPRSTFLRVREGKLPFHATPPQAEGPP